METVTVVFNPHEKEVLLHSLYKSHPQLEPIMVNIITNFEQIDHSKTISTKRGRKKIIELFLADQEDLFPPIASFYKDSFGFAADPVQKTLLEAGIFYTIGKLLLVKYHHRKGLNKLMYAANLPNLPERFTPLYLFRLGGVNLEQGMIVEAGDILEMAIHCCRRYRSDPIMRKLEELILYQILRVYVIKENLSKAKKIIDTLREILDGEENIIFSSLLGYYYRNTREIKKALGVLDSAYEKYKKAEDIKQTFSRSWFNTIYQRAYCYLEMGDLAQATVLIKEACSNLGEIDYRNRGYGENLMGEIELRQPKSDLNQALKHFQRAYDYFEEYNDYRNMARVKRNIGKTLFKLKKHPDAIQAFNQSLAYDYRTQVEIGIIRTLLAKMELRIELIQYYKAREYLKRIQKLNLPRNHYLQEEIKKRKKLLSKLELPQDEIVGESNAIHEIKEEIQRCAGTDMRVLILGERGVGKGMVAKVIHKHSGRKGRFIKINCPAIPHELLENELFGHVEEAFTGAQKIKPGLLEQADRGTVFLDEIGDLPANFQVKLLQFVEEKIIRPVGGTEYKQLDVRIICATNKDLQKEIDRNTFRNDFYDRISDLTIYIPPLRGRREDIRKLAEYFYVQNCRKQERDICGIEADALNLIEDYPWFGNVRELKKTIRRCIHRLEDDQPISRECILGAIDRRSIRLKDGLGEKPQEDQNVSEYLEEVSIQEMNQRLKRVEVQLSNMGDGSRITDRNKMVNELFRIIQEQGPIRKADIVRQCPALGKSFHHWINILKDEYQAIEVGNNGNHKIYKVVSQDILEEKLSNGELGKGDNSCFWVKWR